MPEVMLLLDDPISGSSVVSVETCADLRRLLETPRRVRSVLTDLSVSDGNWATVLRDVVARRPDAAVVVCDQRPTAKVRGEALHRGARYTGGAAREVVRRLLSIRRRKPLSAAGRRNP